MESQLVLALKTLCGFGVSEPEKIEDAEYEGRPVGWHYDALLWSLSPRDYVDARPFSFWLSEITRLPRKGAHTAHTTPRWIVMILGLGLPAEWNHKTFRGLMEDPQLLDAFLIAIETKMWPLVDRCLIEANKHPFFMENRVLFCPRCHQKIPHREYQRHSSKCSGRG